MVLTSTIIISYQIFGSIEGHLKITSIHPTYDDYSCPLIDTGGITPWYKLCLKSRYIGPLVRSGKLIKGFSRHLLGLGRQLSEIDIEIRLIMHGVVGGHISFEAVSFLSRI